MARDISRKQFADALKRNGFADDGLGLWFRDVTAERPGMKMYGAVVDLKTYRICRRDTIARLIKDREADRRKTK